jgi:hypothetical protein
VKPKTAFESGNSPPKVSKSGALIQTGRGLEETKRRIMEAFRLIHNDQPAPARIEKQAHVYTESHAEKFHQRAKALTRSALTSSHVLRGRANGNVWEIAVPTETAEDLFKAALGRDE